LVLKEKFLFGISACGWLLAFVETGIAGAWDAGCRESKLSCWLDAQILSTLGVTNGLRISSTPYYGHFYNGEQGFEVDQLR
jgi:hypothetical protein